MSMFSRAWRKSSAGTLSPFFAAAGALRHPGRSLDASIHDDVERRPGFDFSRVRIHTDESAAASPETAERQARNAYPNNPRAAALQKKMILGTITKPEMSELRGIASFPDNPRGALLYAKMDAGTITPAEQEELRGYFSREAQKSAFDGDLASLDRQRENPRVGWLRARQAAGSLSREEEAELQGLNGYPDNPRAAALAKKRILGTLTREEKAELQGFDTYPYNRRAAALFAKTLLNEKLTPDERGELSDEFYYQAMGEFLIRLERRAREGRLREGEPEVYERLRHDPKVLRRAAQIRESGGPASSLIDD